MPDATTFFQAVTTDLSNLKTLNANTEMASDVADGVIAASQSEEEEE